MLQLQLNYTPIHSVCSWANQHFIDRTQLKDNNRIVRLLRGKGKLFMDKSQTYVRRTYTYPAKDE